MTISPAISKSKVPFLQNFALVAEAYRNNLISRDLIKEYCKITEYKLNILLRAYYEDRLDAELKRMSTAP